MDSSACYSLTGWPCLFAHCVALSLRLLCVMGLHWVSGKTFFELTMTNQPQPVWFFEVLATKTECLCEMQKLGEFYTWFRFVSCVRYLILLYLFCLLFLFSKLLLEYSGIAPGDKKRGRLQAAPLSEEDFGQLLFWLNKEEHGKPLKKLLEKFAEDQSARQCPKWFQWFLEGLARNGPVCGFVQFLGGSLGPVQKTIEDVLNGLPIRQPKNADKFQQVQQQAPSFAGLFSSMPEDVVCKPLSSVLREVSWQQ